MCKSSIILNKKEMLNESTEIINKYFSPFLQYLFIILCNEQMFHYIFFYYKLQHDYLSNRQVFLYFYNCSSLATIRYKKRKLNMRVCLEKYTLLY